MKNLSPNERNLFSLLYAENGGNQDLSSPPHLVKFIQMPVKKPVTRGSNAVLEGDYPTK